VIAEPRGLEHLSLFANVISADFPDWMDNLLNPNNKDQGFDHSISIGGGAALDYFLRANREGLYFGMINLFFNNEVARGGQSVSILSHNIIPRAGYRWYPFKTTTFYLNPFAGFRYEYLISEEVIVDGSAYDGASLQPFGTIHIGYHF
ncbi:MAG: hypothetical protein AAF789_14420, partial [Bacteroidota bacterium]